MINKIFRKLTIRNIKSNFKQFLSIILIVFLSTMLLSGFIVNASTLEKSVENYYEDTNLADLWVYVDRVSDSDVQFYEKLKREHNIEFEERLYFETPVKVSSVALENTAKIYVSKGSISNPYVETPAYLDLGKKGCLIDKKVANNHNIRTRTTNVSFELDLSVGGVEVTTQIEAPINGLMCFDECVDTFSSWPIFFSEEEFLNILNLQFEKQGIPQIDKLPYNQVLIKTTESEHISEMISEYYNSGQTDSKLAFVFDRTQMESVILLNGEVSQAQKMIYVFPIIFLIVAVLVILTTTNQLIIQEQNKIGTLKSLGVSDKKILSHYSKYGAVLVCVGGVIGTILGAIIIPNIMFIKYNLAYSLPIDYIKTNVPWLIILLMLGSIIFMGYLVSYLSCLKILHKKPIECLRKDVKLNDKSLSEVKTHKKTLPLPVKMAIRNVRLKPLRTLMATIGIAGCTALLLCGFGIGDTLLHSKSNDLGKVFKYEISSTYTNDEFLKELENKDLKITEKELYQTYYVQAISEKAVKNISIYQLQPNSKLCEISLRSGDAVISKSIADDLKISVGDMIKLSISGETKSIRITGLIETSVFNALYVCDSLGFSNTYASKGVWICSDLDNEKVVDEINKINGTSSAVSMNKMIEKVENTISSIDVMTTTVKIFAIMLAVVVLLNLIFLILKERHKEIATLKVLGESNITIGLSILYEMLIMAVLGTILGSFLGYPLLTLVLSINRVEVFNFIYYLSPLSFVWTITLILITILIVIAICQNKVQKINMVESLKSME